MRDHTFLKEVKISIRNLPSEITITFTAKLFNYVLEPSTRSIKINYPAASWANIFYPEIHEVDLWQVYVHGFATKTKARAREIPLATQASLR